MKVAPLIRAIERHPSLSYSLVHTGQHYDHDMNDVFFAELGIPKPEVNLNCGGGSHAEQTAKVMLGFERVLLADRPDWVVVVGDVNSTLACSITAKKLCIRVAHVEAGLRSGDLSMPEEINRLVTDSISDLFFVTEPSAEENLLQAGHAREKIHFVGHVMIDNLFFQVRQLDANAGDVYPTSAVKRRLAEGQRQYGVVTLHRPANVDDEPSLRRIVSALSAVADRMPLFFPVHPRTDANLKRFGIDLSASITQLRPLPYMEFLNLWKDASLILTDSGGLQEESTALGVPCVTLRENTERPVTVTHGSNVLGGTQTDGILRAVEVALRASGKKPAPPLWDGRAAERIVEILALQPS